MSPSSKDQESTMKVYVATHCRNDEELGSRKIIGIFSSQESAHAAVDAISEELEEQDSIDYPDLFTVAAYDLDEVLFRRPAILDR
jgi:hypothetical protein